MIYVAISLVILILLQIQRKSIEDILVVRNVLFLTNGQKDKLVDPTNVDYLGIMAIVPGYRIMLLILLVALTINKEAVVKVLIKDYNKTSNKE